ncbi:MAG: helix-turn-helix transcriptional regulator [Deltaproteobacteria bacterium]|nr:helix-turn-helix transcriptional regulator [Deltaproteobacteria bacterium]
MEKYKKMVRLIGSRIREFRYNNRWEQSDLENRANGAVSRSCISYFENARRCPSVKSLFEIANALDVEPAQLLLDPKKNDRHELIARLFELPDDILFDLIYQFDLYLLSTPSKKKLYPKVEDSSVA